VIGVLHWQPPRQMPRAEKKVPAKAKRTTRARPVTSYTLSPEDRAFIDAQVAEGAADPSRHLP
jgi:hypothetical protein